MIKTLTEDEFTVELIAPIFRDVQAAVPDSFLPDKIDLPHVVRTWRRLMGEKVAQTWAGYVGGKAVGVLGGLFITEFFTGQPMAMEQFWFVIEAHRKSGLAIRMFRLFEQEAEKQGAKTLWAGTNRFHQPWRMQSLYERLGYHWWGTTFRKLV